MASDEIDWSEDTTVDVKSPLEKQFDKAARAVRNVSGKLDQSTLLYLYSRYKVVSEGKCQTPRPGGLFNLEAKRKWDSWAELGDMPKETAMEEYIAKVGEFVPAVLSDCDKEAVGQSAFGLSVSRPAALEVESSVKDSPLVALVKSGDVEGVRSWLEGNGSSGLNDIDDAGLAPIHWAADRGFHDVLEVLLSCGAKVNLTDAQDHQTALHYASSCGHVECVKLLLKHKAVMIRDANGETPADLAIDSEVRQLLRAE